MRVAMQVKVHHKKVSDSGERRQVPDAVKARQTTASRQS